MKKYRKRFNITKLKVVEKIPNITYLQEWLESKMKKQKCENKRIDEAYYVI